ncbi:MAG: hypothetical protein IJU68_03885, partial [Bacteroidales bacterium]|nr:hypothetical protein [Bacteroidales bacterium]
ASDSLLACAREHNDTRAESLYYTAALRDAVKLQLDPEQQDILVDEALDAVEDASSRLGYTQDFYYACDLAHNYYFNSGRLNRSVELAQRMYNYALEHGNDDFGKWMSSRYMVSLYVSQHDYVNARRFIVQALDTYERSLDPMVKNQSVTRLYCDLADYYLPGSDSAKICISKALDSRRSGLDSLRCCYMQAKGAAFLSNLPEYWSYRDQCLGNPSLSVIAPSGPLFFDIIDSVFDGSADSRMEDALGLSRVLDLKFIARLLEKNGYRNDALFLFKEITEKLQNQLSNNNLSSLTEVEAKIGHMALEAKLKEQEASAQRARQLLYIVVISTLLLVVAFLLVIMSSYRTKRLQDASRIEELKEANERAIAADKAKSHFVQNMSHEVRTPLNAIVGFSQLLALPDGSFSTEEKESFSSHIINNTQMLTMLLDDIINASDMDNNMYRVRYENCECHFLCKAAISSSEHRLQPGVEMRYEPESKEPFNFRSDPRRIQQILINMLTNACKHTVQGSIVLASSTSVNPGYVTFTVTDTGHGIPDDQAEAIFERFVKLEEFVQGTGLGLSICREIATRMNAKIYLDTSYKEGGARFVFMVPVTDNQITSSI